MPLPVAGDWAIIVLSGFLVGYGTVLGGGCTSGHGICGMSRLSKRSLVSVPIFMGAGIATASITPFTPPAVTIALAAATAAAGIAVNVWSTYRAARVTAAASLASQSQASAKGGSGLPLASSSPASPPSFVDQLTNWRELTVAVATGLIFGAGLAVSEMTNPSVVIHFLQLDADWNPSLMFVMGTALPVALVGFYFTFKRDAPVCGAKFHLPAENKITPSLVGGGILFGVGWGLAGICPGPGVVTLVIGSLDYYAWFLAMVGGLWAYYCVTQGVTYLSQRNAAATSTTSASSSSSGAAPPVGSILNPFTSSANLFDSAPASSRLNPTAYHRVGVE